VTHARTRLAELERKALIGTLSDEELWNRARYTEELGGVDAAVELYTTLIARNERHVGALFHRGQILLARDDDRGIDDLSAAIRLDATLEQPACELVARYHRRKGSEAEAKPYQLRYWELEEQAENARRERLTIRSDDRFVEHGLDAAAVAAVREELVQVGGVKRAFLVRKRVAGENAAPYVIGIVSDAPWWHLATDRAEGALAARVSERFRLPGEVVIVALRTNSALLKRFRSVPHSEIAP
jgi:hypothetical protein